MKAGRVWSRPASSGQEVGRGLSCACPPVDNLLADMQCHRLNGVGWVDAGSGGEHAGISDEQILDAMACAGGIDDGFRRVDSHPTGAHDMPASIADRPIGEGAPSAGLD